MTTYDERQVRKQEFRREQAHKALRDRGYTDDVPTDTCLTLALFWLLGLAAVLVSITGMVTL